MLYQCCFLKDGGTGCTADHFLLQQTAIFCRFLERFRYICMQKVFRRSEWKMFGVSGQLVRTAFGCRGHLDVEGVRCHVFIGTWDWRKMFQWGPVLVGQPSVQRREPNPDGAPSVDFGV